MSYCILVSRWLSDSSVVFISQKTFQYDSHLWSNKETFNPGGGQTGFDYNETKLPTYWDTSFSKICLSMKIDQQIRFIVTNKTASPLYSVVADGEFRKTTLGRNTWKSLIGSEGSLQVNCNREGFNAKCTSSWHNRARIGILGNDQNDCSSCDSGIAFGMEVWWPVQSASTCGNLVFYNANNGVKEIEAMGFIFVQ